MVNNRSDKNNKWSTQKIRDEFISFFEKYNHKKFKSSSLIPSDDPTLLFINAGMVPFKRRFLGDTSDGIKRAVSSQRCVRAGGKHNDLEQVGYTARHHTFFEMLGNFSFGDYFKKDAIEFAWKFLTEILGIDKNKLWVTVFNEDQEAEDIWLNDIGVDSNRLSRIGAKDNFWSMGETGPCGPCTEIFYDHGEDVFGGPPGTKDEDGDRYVEIWNLVFMQYDRQSDGELKPLPAPSVDTGMGLERIAAVMQGVHSNYDIDIFQELLKNIENKLELSSDKISQESTQHSMKAIADHIRSCCFLILDGIEPSNEGRGYVLRRIMRRALRHAYHLGHNLNDHGLFFCNLIYPLADIMGGAYPGLIESKDQIHSILAKEEKQFAQTLAHGMKHLGIELNKLNKSDSKHKQKLELPGDVVFKLYDTYGFPVDLTADLLREKGVSIDYPGFEKAMTQQKDRARASGKFNKASIDVKTQSKFMGYNNLSFDANVKEIFALSSDKETQDQILPEQIQVLKKGERGVLVLDQTPFYAESGGQVGDVGFIISDSGNSKFEFKVTDTQKMHSAYLHYGKVVSGEVSVDNKVSAQVDEEIRVNTRRHHSATHLVHEALREVLGNKVMQKGSLVNSDKLRLDFSYDKPVGLDEIIKIERLVNEQILKGLVVETIETSIENAKKMGAMALFGEKYGDSVRVLKMGDFSCELCGGTHVSNTSECGLFKIISSVGVASGVRRIEAICGIKSLEYLQKMQVHQDKLSKVLRCHPDEMINKCEQIIKKQKKLEKQISGLGSSSSINNGGPNLDSLINKVQQVEDVKLLVEKLPDNTAVPVIRSLSDSLKDKLGKNMVLVLVSIDNGKVRLLTRVGDGMTNKIKANELVSYLAEQVGGKGGGRADMAQAGGENPSGLDKALAGVMNWVAQRSKNT